METMELGALAVPVIAFIISLFKKAKWFDAKDHAPAVAIVVGILLTMVATKLGMLDPEPSLIKSVEMGVILGLGTIGAHKAAKAIGRRGK